LKELFRKLGFTRNDLLLIAFLLLAFSAGLVIKFTGWNNKKEYDYSEQDKNFEQYLKSSFSSAELSKSKQERLKLLKNVNDSLLKVSENSGSPVPDGMMPGKKIDINTAYSADLELLPGIGKVMAERIIEYRELNDGFTRIEDIMNVKGIGEKKFNRIKDYITVESKNSN
jgi:comEA protein